jgi:MFS transporter, putative metabolite:H+ symporter
MTGTAISASDRSAEHAARLITSLDQSAFTSRHGWIFGALMFGHFFDGFDLVLMGVALPGITAAFHITPPEAGFLASSGFFGMFVGAIGISMLADRIGRKRALILSVLGYSLLSAAAAFVQDYSSLLLVRIVQGLGLGAEVPLVYTFVSELVPVRRRGLLLTGSAFFWQGSNLVAALVAIVVIPWLSWRGMFLVGALPAVLILPLWWRLPESPRYLIHKGRIAEADALVREISTVSPDKVTVDPALLRPQPQGGLAEIVSGRYLPRTIGVWLMQLCTGFVALGMGVWLPSILIRSGFELVQSFAYTAIISGCAMAGTTVAALLADRVSRRTSLTVFSFLGGIFMVLWGMATSPAAMITCAALAAFFGLGGNLGLVFGYTPEIYPTRLRGTGSGWGTSFQRIGGFLAPSVLGVLVGAQASNFAFFLVLGCVLLFSSAVSSTLVYETRGKSLEQIAAALGC